MGEPIDPAIRPASLSRAPLVRRKDLDSLQEEVVRLRERCRALIAEVEVRYRRTITTARQAKATARRIPNTLVAFIRSNPMLFVASAALVLVLLARRRR